MSKDALFKANLKILPYIYVMIVIPIAKNVNFKLICVQNAIQEPI